MSLYADDDSYVYRCNSNAFDFGFQCTVIHDACATKDLSFKNATIPAVYIHNTILASLNGVYANVISTQEFLVKNTPFSEQNRKECSLSNHRFSFKLYYTGNSQNEY